MESQTLHQPGNGVHTAAAAASMVTRPAPDAAHYRPLLPDMPVLGARGRSKDGSGQAEEPVRTVRLV